MPESAQSLPSLDNLRGHVSELRSHISQLAFPKESVSFLHSDFQSSATKMNAAANSENGISQSSRSFSSSHLTNVYESLVTILRAGESLRDNGCLVDVVPRVTEAEDQRIVNSLGAFLHFGGQVSSLKNEELREFYRCHSFLLGATSDLNTDTIEESETQSSVRHENAEYLEDFHSSNSMDCTDCFSSDSFSESTEDIITETLARSWVCSELLGDSELALQELDALLLRVPAAQQNPFLFFLRGRLHHNFKKQMKDSLADYCHCIGTMVSLGQIPFPLAYANRGVIHFRSQQYVNSLQDFSSAIQLDPQNSKCYYKRSLVYMNIPNCEMLALQDVNQAIALKNDEGDYYLHRGSIFYKMYSGCTSAQTLEAQECQWHAFQDFQKAIELLPNKAQPFCTIGLFYSRSGNAVEAERYLNAAVKNDPHFVNGYLYRASVRSSMQKYDDAWRDLQNAKQLCLYLKESGSSLYCAAQDQLVEQHGRSLKAFLQQQNCRGNT